jgi:hypothetical protein
LSSTITQAITDTNAVRGPLSASDFSMSYPIVVRIILNTKHILVEIDAEIARLQEARKLLATDSRGTTKAVKTRRPLSPEARAKIAAGQKKRWAKAKKAGK